MLYLTDADIQQAMTVAEAMELADRGIQADAAGKIEGEEGFI